MAIESVNPATGERARDLRSLLGAGRDRRRRGACAAAQPAWAERSFAERAAPAPRRRSGLLREEKQALAELMAREMGKPLAQGIAEAEKCAWVCEYYAEGGRGLPRGPAGRDRREEELRLLRAARHRARRDAVELPLLAGLPLRGARADGRATAGS